MRYFYLLLIGGIWLASSSIWAAERQKAEVLKVTDGDTVVLLLDGAEIKLRLSDIDCFENKLNLRARWQAETYSLTLAEVLYRGKKSAAVLVNLLQENRRDVYVLLKAKDVYRRRLGRLYLFKEKQWVDINQYMLQYGGCVLYKAKPKGWKAKK